MLPGVASTKLRRLDISIPEPPIDDFENIAGHIETVIPEIASRVQSAADTVATEASKVLEDIRQEIDQLINRLGEILPQNFTVGTSEFCVGSSEKISCSYLPPKVDISLPNDVTDSVAAIIPELDEATSDAQAVLYTLKQLGRHFFEMLWYSVLGLMFFMFVLTRLGKCPGLLYPCLFTIIVMGVVSLFVIAYPPLILHHIQSQGHKAPDWISIKAGRLIMYHWIGFGCVAVYSAMCIVSVLF